MPKNNTKRKQKQRQLAKLAIKDAQRLPATARDMGARADHDLAAYKAALSNPFDAAACGARVPDMYSVPTSTRRITKTMSVTTNALGNALVSILPSAYIHGFLTMGSTSAGSFTTGAGEGVAGCLTPPATLGSQLSNYRIVGYGVKVFTTQNETNVAGKLHLATVPVSSWLNTVDTVGGQADNHADSAQTLLTWMSDMGMSTAPGTMPSMANSVLLPLANVQQNPVEIRPKLTSPEGMNFRQTKDSTVGYMATDQTSTSWITAGDASYLRVAGHEAVQIGIEGATASTGVIEIELVYHLEGTNALAATQTGVVQSEDRMVTNPLGWMRVVAEVANLPSFRTLAVSALDRVIPGLGALATRVI